MTYFYDYFAKEYREKQKDRLPSFPAAMSWNIKPDDVQGCRRGLKNAFSGYREGKDAEILIRLFKEYREYVAESSDGHAKDRYNAFVYRYMAEAYWGSRAIASKLGVTKDTVWNYINRCFDEMLVLCMGIPAAGRPTDKRIAVRVLVSGNRMFQSMAGGYVLQLFPGRRQGQAVRQGREITGDIMQYFAGAVEAYLDYCRDSHACIGTDIRKAGVLERCLAGVPPAAIAKEFGCCESTVYADMRENEKRLAAMLFDSEYGITSGNGSRHMYGGRQ